MLDARGNKILLFQDPSAKRFLQNAVVRARQVRIVSYPRSGRTWLRVMLHELGLNPRFTHAGSKAELRLLPSEIADFNKKLFRNRVVHLTRDPRDVIVSYYFHLKAKDEWMGTLKEMIRDERYGFERILAYQQAMRKDKGNFQAYLEISYENLRNSSVDTIKRLTSFIYLPLISEKSIRRAVEHNEFNNMKKREKSGELHQHFGDRFSRTQTVDAEMTVRRGIMGGFTDFLDSDDLAFCDSLIRRYVEMP